MTEFVRRLPDRKIFPVRDSAEKDELLSTGTYGATATVGIVEFLKDWPSPSRRYKAGEFEKFDLNDTKEAAVVADLVAKGIVRRIPDKS
jgi:hypothetical protein